MQRSQAALNTTGHSLSSEVNPEHKRRRTTDDDARGAPGSREISNSSSDSTGCRLPSIRYQYLRPPIICLYDGPNQPPPKGGLVGTYDILLESPFVSAFHFGPLRKFLQKASGSGYIRIESCTDHDERPIVLRMHLSESDGEKRKVSTVCGGDRGWDAAVDGATLLFMPLPTDIRMGVAAKLSMVGARSATGLLSVDSSGRQCRPPGDAPSPESRQDVRVGIDEADEMLNRHKNVTNHWLFAHTSLPPEIARKIKMLLCPPPAFVFEVGDIWIDFNQLAHDGVPKRFQLLARKRP